MNTKKPSETFAETANKMTPLRIKLRDEPRKEWAFEGSFPWLTWRVELQMDETHLLTRRHNFYNDVRGPDLEF